MAPVNQDFHSTELHGRLSSLAEAIPRHARPIILTHDFPDPDALASAGALHLLLARHFHYHSLIAYSGMVTRAENREMLRHFRYHIRPLEEIRRRRRALALLVDAQPHTGKITLPDWVVPVAVFDHHPPSPRLPPGLWRDIRPHIGACSSVLYEYLAAAGVPVPAWLASCMVYAIETETMDFTRGGTAFDRTAYLDLLPRASLRILGRIKHAPLPLSYFSLLQQATASARWLGRVAWTHLPQAPNPEIAAEVADRLVRLENITHAFCTALGPDTLWISVRSNRRNAGCAAWVRAAVRSRGSAGGHDRLAAGSIPITGLSAEERNALLDEVHSALLRHIARRAGIRTSDAEHHAQRLLPTYEARADSSIGSPAAPPS